MFLQYLANSLTSPASRRNYKSGAKWWIQLRGGDISAFTSVEAKAVEKGAANLSTHVTSPAPPLFPPDIKVICEYLDRQDDGLVVKSTLLIGFFGVLRASNLLLLSGEVHTP